MFFLVGLFSPFFWIHYWILLPILFKVLIFVVTLVWCFLLNHNFFTLWGVPFFSFFLTYPGVINNWHYYVLPTILWKYPIPPWIVSIILLLANILTSYRLWRVLGGYHRKGHQRGQSAHTSIGDPPIVRWAVGHWNLVRVSIYYPFWVDWNVLLKNLISTSSYKWEEYILV